jgi:prefoldin subunit 5
MTNQQAKSLREAINYFAKELRELEEAKATKAEIRALKERIRALEIQLTEG